MIKRKRYGAGSGEKRIEILSSRAKSYFKNVDDLITPLEKANIERIQKIEGDRELYSPEAVYAAIDRRDIRSLEKYAGQGLGFGFDYDNTTPLLHLLDPDKSHVFEGDPQLSGDGILDEKEKQIILLMASHGGALYIPPSGSGWNPFMLILNDHVYGEGSHRELLIRLAALQPQVLRSQTFRTLGVAGNTWDYNLLSMVIDGGDQVLLEALLSRIIETGDYYGKSLAMGALYYCLKNENRSFAASFMKYHIPVRHSDTLYLAIRNQWFDEFVTLFTISREELEKWRDKPETLLSELLVHGIYYDSKEIVDYMLDQNADPRIPAFIDDPDCYEYGRDGEIYTGPGEMAAIQAASEFHDGKYLPLLSECGD